MLADLHLHTTCSDGTISPRAIVELVCKAGLGAFSVTDHDTVEAIPIVEPLAQEAGILFIPGLEINTYRQGKEYHILGYNFDHQNSTLTKTLEEVRTGRITRMHRMIGQLQEVGIGVSFEDVLAVANGKSLCRPHLANVLLQKGFVISINEAFKRYLVKGQAGYVSRKTISPNEAVELIHNAGGIAILAHPGRMAAELTASIIRSLGIDGLEVFHPDHNETTTTYLKKLVEDEALLPTGGSDFHGYTRNNSKLDYITTETIGSQPVPLEWAQRLLNKKGGTYEKI